MNLLTGFYVTLFGMYIYMMCTRPLAREICNARLYFWLTVVLFALSTLSVADSTIRLVRETIIYFTAVSTGEHQIFIDYSGHDVGKIAVYSLQTIIPVLLNIAADYMLIHRCYVIWGSQKQVALPLIAASIITNALGIAGSILRSDLNHVLHTLGNNISFTYNICSVVVNSSVTLLTGHIWWIHRQVYKHGAYTCDTLLHSVTSIILESGIIYPTSTVINLIAANTTSIDMLPFDFSSFMFLGAGVAPTLIIVRAKLGSNVETLQDRLSEICFSSEVPTTARPQKPKERATSKRQQVYEKNLSNDMTPN
uniref:Uncharacterized protein n=1 Tax=Moniliophthora roreri TaxID=221103 RepID=A0A0W0G6I1_MONRR